MNIAIIPARGGSKRIPKKNIRDFCGRPMLAWPIEAAQSSGLFDRIIVSTDDKQIASAARNSGAETPFLRPKELADDYTGTSAVVRHCLEWLMEKGQKPDWVCCIYATAPFLQPEDLKKGFDILQEGDCSLCFSVTSFPFPIQRSLRITNNSRLEPIFPEQFPKRSQDLEQAYHDAGQFYWMSPEIILKQDSELLADAKPVIVPRYRVQDIDDLEDWKHAELMFKVLQDRVIECR